MCVRHVLPSVDLVELTFAITDLERVITSVVSVFAEVGTNEGTVSLRVVVVKDGFKAPANHEPGETTPAPCHLLETSDARDDLHCEVETTDPCESAGTFVSGVHASEVFTVLVTHVVGEEISLAGSVIVNVIEFEVVFFSPEAAEPGSVRHLVDTAEVAHWG